MGTGRAQAGPQGNSPAPARGALWASGGITLLGWLCAPLSDCDAWVTVGHVGRVMAKSEVWQKDSGWQEGGTKAASPIRDTQPRGPGNPRPCPRPRRGLWERGQRAPARLLPAASWSPRASPRPGRAGGPRCKDSLASRPLSPHRRVAVPGTQCPWHGRPPPHDKGPFVPTSLALKPRVTGLCWTRGARPPPASAGPGVLFGGAFSPVQTLRPPPLPREQRPIPTQGRGAHTLRKENKCRLSQR